MSTLVIEIEQPSDRRIIYVRLNYHDSFHVQLEGNPKGHTQQSRNQWLTMHSTNIKAYMIAVGIVHKWFNVFNY